MQVEVVDSTPHHWIGSHDDVVLGFLYPGSEEDASHVWSATRAVDRAFAKVGRPIRCLFCAPTHSKPPGAVVRGAISASARRFMHQCDRIGVVLPGTGFSPAIHRGVITGLVSLARPRFPVKVYASIDDALEFVLGVAHPALADLKSLAAVRALGPARERNAS